MKNPLPLFAAVSLYLAAQASALGSKGVPRPPQWSENDWREIIFTDDTKRLYNLWCRKSQCGPRSKLTTVPLYYFDEEAAGSGKSVGIYKSHYQFAPKTKTVTQGNSSFNAKIVDQLSVHYDGQKPVDRTSLANDGYPEEWRSVTVKIGDKSYELWCRDRECRNGKKTEKSKLYMSVPNDPKTLAFTGYTLNLATDKVTTPENNQLDFPQQTASNTASFTTIRENIINSKNIFAAKSGKASSSAPQKSKRGKSPAPGTSDPHGARYALTVNEYNALASRVDPKDGTAWVAENINDLCKTDTEKERHISAAQREYCANWKITHDKTTGIVLANQKKKAKADAALYRAKLKENGYVDIGLPDFPPMKGVIVVVDTKSIKTVEAWNALSTNEAKKSVCDALPKSAGAAATASNGDAAWQTSGKDANSLKDKTKEIARLQRERDSKLSDEAQCHGMYKSQQTCDNIKGDYAARIAALTNATPTAAAAPVASAPVDPKLKELMERCGLFAKEEVIQNDNKTKIPVVGNVPSAGSRDVHSAESREGTDSEKHPFKDAAGKLLGQPWFDGNAIRMGVVGAMAGAILGFLPFIASPIGMAIGLGVGLYLLTVFNTKK